MAGPKPSTSIEEIERQIAASAAKSQDLPEAQAQTEADGTPKDPATESAGQAATAPTIDLSNEPGAELNLNDLADGEVFVTIELPISAIAHIHDALDHYKIHLVAMAQRAASETSGSLLNPQSTITDEERKMFWDKTILQNEAAGQLLRQALSLD